MSARKFIKNLLSLALFLLPLLATKTTYAGHDRGEDDPVRVHSRALSFGNQAAIRGALAFFDKRGVLQDYALSLEEVEYKPPPKPKESGASDSQQDS